MNDFHRLFFVSVILISILLISCADQPASDQAITRPDFTIQQWSLQNKVIGKTLPYTVYMPCAGPPESGWPVLYFLYGRGRNHRTIVYDPNCIEHISKQSFVIVFPTGEDGWYIDSPVKPESKYQTMLLELIDKVQSELPVSADPVKTGICGWSMGGFGAMRFAFDHPDKVSAVAPLIPPPGLLQSRTAGGAELPHSPGFWRRQS